MATLTVGSQLTLAELQHAKDPSGNPTTVAKVLTRTNKILLDAPWFEANDTFSHMIVRDSYLPTGTHRKLNEGVAIDAPRTITVYEALAILESFAQCDALLADAAPDPMSYRMGRANRHIEGMAQTMATKLIYGNGHTTPEEPTGLAPRMADTDCNNVVSAGGSGGDTTSIYIVQWGEGKAYMVYPKAHPNTGITHEDLGRKEVDVSTTAGTHSLMMAYRDHFAVNYGLAVEDIRCIARVANIEYTGTSNIFDPDDLISLMNAMPGEGEGAVIYCNKDIFTQMDIQAMDKSNVLYSVGDVFGVPTVKFRGFPVRKVDAIVNTETAVSS